MQTQSHGVAPLTAPLQECRSTRVSVAFGTYLAAYWPERPNSRRGKGDTVSQRRILEAKASRRLAP